MEVQCDLFPARVKHHQLAFVNMGMLKTDLKAKTIEKCSICIKLSKKLRRDLSL